MECNGAKPLCATPLRTLAPWPRTSLPQVISPTSTTSRRLMSNTSRSPRASSGSPMTSTTMTSPSARCSLTHAEDEPITLKKKACRPVCRRQSVMIERGDPLLAHLVHKFRVSKKLRDTPLKVNRLGLSWNDKESRFSLTVQQRFKNEFQADSDRRSIQESNGMIRLPQHAATRPRRRNPRQQEEMFLNVVSTSRVMKDEPERRSRSHLARSTETIRSDVVVAKTAAQTVLLVNRCKTQRRGHED